MQFSRCACISEQPGLPRNGWYCERLRHDRRVALGPPCCVSSPTQLSFSKPSTTSGHMDLLTVVTRQRQAIFAHSLTIGCEAKRVAMEPSRPQPRNYRERERRRTTCVTHHNNTTDTNKGDHDHLPFPRTAPDASEAEVI